MATGDLTVLGDVKEYLGISVSAIKDDDLLGKLISQASAVISTYCSIDFVQTTYSEQRDGNDATRLMLQNLPVNSVSSVNIDGQNVPPGGNSQTSGFWCDGTFVYVKGYRFNRGFSNVIIGYTAGYNTIPLDVQMVCIEIVANKYKRKDRIGKNSEGMTGQQTNYSAVDIGPDNAKVLAKYNRVGLA